MEATTNQTTMGAGAVTEKKKKSYPGKKITGKSYDRWYKVYWRKFKNPTISFRIGPASYFDNRLHIHFDLLWISVYLDLPIYSTWDECEYPEYGFYYHSNSLVLCWGMKNKFIYMPWTYEWVRTSKLKKDGTWETEVKGDKKDFWKDEWKEVLWSEFHPYPYRTKYGVEQNDIIATIGVEEMEWRQKWLMWTPLFSMVHKSISVEFNNEVGSERGSWKGGCTGCGYGIKPGETPYQTLMRMNKERSFDR